MSKIYIVTQKSTWLPLSLTAEIRYNTPMLAHQQRSNQSTTFMRPQYSAFVPLQSEESVAVQAPLQNIQYAGYRLPPKSRACSPSAKRTKARPHSRTRDLPRLHCLAWLQGRCRPRRHYMCARRALRPRNHEGEQILPSCSCSWSTPTTGIKDWGRSGLLSDGCECCFSSYTLIFLISKSWQPSPTLLCKDTLNIRSWSSSECRYQYITASHTNSITSHSSALYLVKCQRRHTLDFSTFGGFRSLPWLTSFLASPPLEHTIYELTNPAITRSWNYSNVLHSSTCL